MTDAYFLQWYGAEGIARQPERFGSEAERLIWLELTRRNIPFVYQWFPGRGGDIPYTPEREARSIDFFIPALRLGINPTDPFTHASAEEDRTGANLWWLYGIRTVYIPETAILYALGGDPARALDDYVPELIGYGQAATRLVTGYRRRKRIFATQPLELSFQVMRRNFGRFRSF